MITSTFGRIFLDAYNEKYGTQYDAKTFFIEQYWPLFFDHNKYLIPAGNSPFENPKISWDKMLSGSVPYETAEQRKNRLERFLNKVEVEGATDASVAWGYAASEEKEFASTSGQVTDMCISKDTDSIFLSWIGASLALGVQGGLSLLFSNKEILLATFEGWKFYRDILNNNQKMKGNQLNSWNGLWIAHRFDTMYDEKHPMDNFMPFESKGNEMSIALNTWTKVLIPISAYLDSPKMMGYVYSFGQTNITIGFIPFALDHIRRTRELYIQLFDNKEYRQAEELFGTAEGLRKSCQMGMIGIKALEPKGLKEHITKGKQIKPKEIEKDTIKFHTYIIWILAMLNNQELWDKAQTIASALKAYSDAGGKSTKNRNAVDTVLGATNKRAFIEGLTEVVKNSVDNEAFVDAAKEVNIMPTDNVPYFLTLIRFQYSTLK